MLYIDSANVAAITELARTPVFAGVTTNPGILKAAGLTNDDIPQLHSELHALGLGQLFFQVWGPDEATMLAAGRKIAALGDDVTVKVPATAAGYSVCRALADDGARVLVTVVFHPTQVVAAASAGAWGVAPYVGRMSDRGYPWQRRLSQICAIAQHEDIRVLAASLRERETVAELVAMGVEDVTFGVPLARAILADADTEEATAAFERMFE